MAVPAAVLLAANKKARRACHGTEFGVDAVPLTSFAGDLSWQIKHMVHK
jgi:hypothetical protein